MVRHMPTFQKVLEEVELQMGRIRVALEERLRSPELSVDEAVNSSVTLLDLGEDQVKVVSEYLTGRTATLRRSLSDCFAAGIAGAAPPPLEEGVELTKDQEELRRPESLALHGACAKATEAYVPPLCDAVEGFQKLIEVRNASSTSVDENVLPDFVSARIEDLCERITQLVDQKCPPSRVLVSCIHSVRDSLRRLHSLLPALLTRLFRAFLGRTAMDAMRSLFVTACGQMTSELCKLHGECKKLGESTSSGLDDVLEEIAKTEQALIMHGFTALTECQPLQSLLGPDKAQTTRSKGGGVLKQMQRLALVALVTLVQAAARSCSCDCCETAVAREEQAVQCSLAQGAPTAPRCENLCAKSADDHLLEASQSFVDTERFCFAECVPAKEEPGTPCQPALGARAGRRALRVQRVKRQPKMVPVALARETATGPAKGNGEVEKVLKETQKQAEKAKEKVEAVQQATFGGIGLVTETAHVEDDARRAAGFALGVEQQVAKQLEEAKRQAHEEAFAVMQQVMPMVKSAARSAAKKEATTGPFSKLEKSQEEQVKATAAAALKGQVAWSNAMEGATKVRDAYSRRSHELSQASCVCVFFWGAGGATVYCYYVI
eukprot:symbB.v1.2.013371.t2/scaffold943.1/size149931/3